MHALLALLPLAPRISASWPMRAKHRCSVAQVAEDVEFCKERLHLAKQVHSAHSLGALSIYPDYTLGYNGPCLSLHLPSMLFLSTACLLPWMLMCRTVHAPVL